MHKNLGRAAARALRAVRCLPPCTRRTRPRLLWLTVCLAGGAAAQATDPASLQACFVYVSPVGQAGWSFQHDQGRQAMERALAPRVRTRFVEAVAEGADSERVMRELARDGCGLVFATSFGYLEPALRVATEFPRVKFEHAGGYKTAANLNTYNARYYEARWLAGYLAGKHSTNGVAGYVAGFPVPEVVQGINAFALGMRAANPRAEVRLVWLNTWFDPAREREAALALIGQGADVLTNHSGSPAVPQAAQDKGVAVVSYQSDMSKFAPRAQLAAVTHHWGGYYTQVAQSVLAGSWQPRPTWGGLKDGFVQLSALNAALPPALRADLDRRREAIVTGRFKPFSAPLVDNAGKTRLDAGALDDARIASMDWLVQGVVGTLPARH
ncbi:MAG: BMP family ABC transporter substrate-binding protein [Burkholderiaceae bacterium]|nr:BMP family ABC transporter substrate-binding protein [Burkholderiaceae bacterium]